MRGGVDRSVAGDAAAVAGVTAGEGERRLMNDSVTLCIFKVLVRWLPNAVRWAKGISVQSTGAGRGDGDGGGGGVGAGVGGSLRLPRGELMVFRCCRSVGAQSI